MPATRAFARLSAGCRSDRAKHREVRGVLRDPLQRQLFERQAAAAGLLPLPSVLLDLADLFHAHIGGVDTFARALIVADAVLQKSDYKKIRTERYASFDSGKGKEYEEGKLSLEDLRAFAVANGEPAVRSGKQELLENIINRAI